MFNHSQELPEQWNNVKKLAVLMKQAVNPLQTAEVGMIRRKLASFDVRSSPMHFDFFIALTAMFFFFLSRSSNTHSESNFESQLRLRLTHLMYTSDLIRSVHFLMLA